MPYVISLDIGTSSVRAILFDEKYKIIFKAQQEIKITSPQNSWIEQNPEELWLKSLSVLESVVKFSQKEKLKIAGLGITNQRETSIIWSIKTGKPIYPAIVWQDKRTVSFCQSLEKKGLAKKIYQKTGLRIDPYFSASKINWILNNVLGARKKARAGELFFGTVDTWMIWKLTGGKNHLTDVSNAGRTMLFDIKKLKWDTELLKIFNIPEAILPKVQASASSKRIFGNAKILKIELPILAVCGDQTAALYGHKCWRTGDIKVTYGTGGFVVANAGPNPKFKNSKLIITPAWQIENKITYALEGSIFQSGGALKWLRDNLRLFKNYNEADILTEKAINSQGVYLVPAFVGLGAPYWQPEARGIILGLSTKTQISNLITAAVESAAYQVDDILQVLSKEYFLKIKKIKIDGGLTENKHLIQFQTDISNILVEKSIITEMTVLGAARLAGQAIGWKNNFHQTGKVFGPKMFEKERNKLKGGWQKAILMEKIFNNLAKILKK